MNLPALIFSIMMACAVVWMVVASRKKKLWRPKDPRSVALIKITLWAGLLTWMVFTLTLSILLARWVPIEILKLLGDSMRGHVLSWVVPIWIIFTTLMLIWAVARFAYRRLKPKEKAEGNKLTLKTK